MIVVITGNQRQNNSLKQQGLFPQALIVTWPEWLIYLWQTFLATETELHLTSPFELDYLWQTAIKDSLPDSNHDHESLAKLAYEAYQLIINYQIPLAALSDYPQETLKWLMNVFTKIESYCTTLGLITPQDIAQQMLSNIDLTKSNITKIIFYHFLEFTPLQKQFIALLKKTGISVIIEGFKTSPACLVTFNKYHQPQHEIDTALHQLTAAYQQNPKQRYALIVPDLPSWRNYIDSQLKSLLLPNALAPSSKPWHFSLQPRLTETSFIQTALKLIRLSYTPYIQLEELFFVLRSPYWNINKLAYSETSKFMELCQSLACEELSWEALLATASTCPTIENILGIWHQPLTYEKKTISTWLVEWQTLLTQLQFSQHDNEFTPVELSLNQQWHELLQDLTGILSWLDPISFHEAWQLLQRYCQHTRCSVTAISEQTIQVIGVLEALGESFDQAWLVHANQGNIPPSYIINPLLPIPIQKKYGIPASSTKQQDLLSINCFNILAAQQPLIVSHAESADDMTLLAAPFCPADTIISESVALQDVATKIPFKKASFLLHPWPEQKPLPGGSGALKAQQECSAKAFAKFRLGLQKMPEPVLGLTAIERGNVAHRGLHLVWQQLKDQNQLITMPDNKLNVLLQRVVRISLREVPWQRRKLLPKSVITLETERQLALLKQWLTLEKTRPPFKIYALEKELTVLFANQKWRLRVDRIDELADGKLLLIDYKTGFTTTNAWRLDYFSEPQLPLYCVSSGLNFVGLAFAEFAPYSMRLKGIAKEAISIGDLGQLEVIQDWQTLQQSWHDLLTELTQQFVNSHANVRPNEKLYSCQYCDLASFCRIFDLTHQNQIGDVAS